MTVSSLLQNTAFLPAELSAVSTARAKVGNLDTIRRQTERDRWERGGPRSWLHLEVDRLGELLGEDPTIENAEAFHRAFLRNQEAELTGERISEALNSASARVSQSLIPTVLAVLDRAEAALDKDATAGRKAAQAAAAAPLAQGNELAQFEGRLAQLRADLGRERERATADPLAWIESRGLAQAPEPTSKSKGSDDLVGSILDSME